MTQEEQDREIKRQLRKWTPDELLELRSNCSEISESYHLGKCAQRLRQIAEHELEAHQCAGSALYLNAVATRLEWYHRKVSEALEAIQQKPVIQ